MRKKTPNQVEGGQRPEQPQPISVGATFRETVLNKTWKIAWLVGPSVLRLRDENPAFAQPNLQATSQQDALLLNPGLVSGGGNAQKNQEDQSEMDNARLLKLFRTDSFDSEDLKT